MTFKNLLDILWRVSAIDLKTKNKLIVNSMEIKKENEWFDFLKNILDNKEINWYVFSVLWEYNHFSLKE